MLWTGRAHCQRQVAFFEELKSNIKFNICSIYQINPTQATFFFFRWQKSIHNEAVFLANSNYKLDKTWINSPTGTVYILHFNWKVFTSFSLQAFLIQDRFCRTKMWTDAYIDMWTITKRWPNESVKTITERWLNESVRLVQQPFGHGSGFVQDLFGPEQIMLVQDWFGRRTVPAGLFWINRTVLGGGHLSILCIKR